MEKFIDKEVIFIPEVKKEEFLIGHTGNYLQLKIKGPKELIGLDVKVKLKKIEYPNILSDIIIQSWLIIVT